MGNFLSLAHSFNASFDIFPPETFLHYMKITKEQKRNVCTKKYRSIAIRVCKNTNFEEKLENKGKTLKHERNETICIHHFFKCLIVIASV